jgi:hypothetical protein
MNAPHPCREVQIALACDNGFRVGVLATLRSLTQHLSKGWRLNVHVLDCGLDDPDELRDVVLEATLSPIDVRMHRMPEDVLERFHLNRPNLSKAAFARLLAPSILADVDRVLYLDSDVLVTGDIVELWRCDLGGLPLGAVRDPLFVYLGQDVRNCRQFGISPLHHYFGTGVMLMDLRQWRNEDVEPRLLELGAPSAWSAASTTSRSSTCTSPDASGPSPGAGTNCASTGMAALCTCRARGASSTSAGRQRRGISRRTALWASTACTTTLCAASPSPLTGFQRTLRPTPAAAR